MTTFKTIVLDLLQQGHQDEETFLQGLTETERTAIGTPEFWSSNDHIAGKCCATGRRCKHLRSIEKRFL